MPITIACGYATALLAGTQQAYLRVLNSLTCGYATGLLAGAQQPYLRVHIRLDGYVPALGTGTSLA